MNTSEPVAGDARPSAATTFVPATNGVHPALGEVGMARLLDELAQDAVETDTDATFPERSFARLARAGLLTVEPATTFGLLQLLKQIGWGNLAVGRIYEGHVNARQLVHRYARPAQCSRWQADAAQGRLFSVWNTEADGGVRIHALGEGRYVLEGAKTFCSGANWIGRPLITGELMDGQPRGWQMAVIPTERVAPIRVDRSFWQPLGMRASVSFRMDFTGIELTDEDLLGQPGDYYRQPHFSGGAIRFAAVQLGGAEALADATRAYLHALGRTSDPMQRARVAEMTWQIESGNQWLRAAGEHADAWLDTDPDRLVSYANMTRTAIADICDRVLALTEQAVGARGLMRPHPIERIHRDLTFYLRQPAPDATLLAIGEYALTQPGRLHALWG